MQHQIHSDQLTGMVRGDILAGRLGGGRLTIDSLARRYGVSHMPVREALRELAGEGLVILETNRGARIAEVDARFVRQLFDTRIALEVMLARDAAQRMTGDAARHLRAIEAARLSHVAQGNFDAAVRANADLHMAIYALSTNAHALALVDRHWRFIAALWARHGHAPERFDGIENDHRHILVALENGDADAAGMLVAAHVLKARQELTALMDKAGAA